MKYILITSMLLFCQTLFSQRTIKSGTLLKFTTPIELKGSDLENGQKLDFELANDYIIDEIVFLKKGLKAKGTVLEAEGSKILGKKGKLDFSIDYLYLDNGKAIKLESNVEAKTKSRGLQTAAITVLVSPVGLLLKGQQAKFAPGSEFVAYVQEDFSIFNKEAARIDQFNLYFNDAIKNNNPDKLVYLNVQYPDLSEKKNVKQLETKMRLDIKERLEVEAKNRRDAESFRNIVNTAPINLTKLDSFIQFNKPNEPLLTESQDLRSNVFLHPNKTAGYIYNYNEKTNKKFNISTMMDSVKKNKNYVIDMYYYFLYDLKSKGEIYGYTHDKYKKFDYNGRVYEYTHPDPFTNERYEVKIDTNQNVVYLSFYTGTNKNRVYAFDPVIGPVPFKNDELGYMFFEGQKEKFLADNKLSSRRTSDYILNFDQSNKTISFYSIAQNDVTSGFRDNLKESINQSNFYLKDIKVDTKKFNVKIVPSYDEKYRLYKCCGLPYVDLMNDNFGYYKEEERGVYKKYLHSVTGFPLFLNPHFEELIPLKDNKFIFKKNGTFGLLDISANKWIKNDFVIVDNVYLSLKLVGENKLEGVTRNNTLYFDTNGELIQQ